MRISYCRKGFPNLLMGFDLSASRVRLMGSPTTSVSLSLSELPVRSEHPRFPRSSLSTPTGGTFPRPVPSLPFLCLWIEQGLRAFSAKRGHRTPSNGVRGRVIPTTLLPTIDFAPYRYTTGNYRGGSSDPANPYGRRASGADPSPGVTGHPQISDRTPANWVVFGDRTPANW